jgi:hypothetical protein
MAGLFDNALAYENQRQQLKQVSALRAALAQQAQQSAMMRMLMQQAAINQRVQTGPAAQRVTMAQKALADKQKQDQATVNWVMSLDPLKVEPQWRYMLSRVQDSLKANPSPEVAKIFTSKYKPAGLQFKTVQTMEDDGSGTGTMVPVTSFVVADPMSGSLGPAGMSPGLSGSSMPGSGGSGRSAGGGLSPSARALAAKYGLGGTTP